LQETHDEPDEVEPDAGLRRPVLRLSQPVRKARLPGNHVQHLQWRPATDISETKKAYVVKAQLPDVKREDVSVTVDNGMLKIEGKREWKKEEDDEKQHRTESFYGTFARSFSLPEDVDVSKIRAETKDGVLTVRLPKSKADKSEPKKIEVG